MQRDPETTRINQTARWGYGARRGLQRLAKATDRRTIDLAGPDSGAACRRTDPCDVRANEAQTRKIVSLQSAGEREF